MVTIKKFITRIVLVSVILVGFFMSTVLAYADHISQFDLVSAENISSVDITAYKKIEIIDAWELINTISSSLSQVKVGIFDFGIELAHQEFDGIEVDSDVIIDQQDDGHGTQVAGIIGANNVSFEHTYIPPQMNGILSGVENLDYALFSRTSLQIEVSIDGFRHFLTMDQLARSGDRAINNSFGTPLCSELNPIRKFIRNRLGQTCYKDIEDLNADKEIYADIVNQYPNITFVFGAGNDGIDAQFSLPGGGVVADNVISVGGTNLNDERAIFGVLSFSNSNFGAVDISAPGIGVYAPKPGGGHTNFSGTSASAPLVTGVAAILKAINPDLTPAQIKQILIETADPIQTGETDKRIGTGCYSDPNDPVNTGCRLNALSAVKAVLPPVSFLDDNAWAMLGKDQYHTSLATASGPKAGATINWTFDAGFGNSVSQPVADADGNIYFGAASNVSGKLVKLDKNGVKQWEYATSVNIGTPAVLSDGTVYFGRVGAGGFLAFTALNPDGTKKWDYSGASTVDAITVSSKGEPHFTFQSGSQQKLIVLNPINGFEKISPLIGVGLSGFTPVVLDDNTIITAGKISGNQQFTAYSADGTQLWQISTSQSFNNPLSNPSHDKSTGITYSAAGRKLFSIPQDGSTLNSVDIAPFNYSATTMVAITSDTLYVGFNNNLNPASGSLLFALNKSNLSTKWSAPFRADGFLNRQLVIDKDGNVYFSTKNGKLYGVDSNGNEMWKIDSGLSSNISPVLTEHGLAWGYRSKVVLVND